MSCVLELFSECEKYNANPTQKSKHIKPILGMEAYIVKDRTKRVKGEPNQHLLLLARNQQGFKNLLKLHYEGYATGKTFVYDRVVPRIDQTLLTPENCKGIIATTGCVASEFAHLLRAEEWGQAADLAEKYKELFDYFFAELQPSHLLGDIQADHNDKILRLARAVDIPLIATTDSHYLTEEEREEHQLVLAIQSKKDIFDEDRFTFEATPLLSTEEMLEHFDAKVISTTQDLADLCKYPDFLRFDKHGYRLPKYPIPDTFLGGQWEKNRKLPELRHENEDESYKFCMSLAEASWDKKLKHIKDPETEQKYRDRLKMEVDVIAEMGFIDYFLIVWDFIDWAKRNDISVGPGRGSCGGSLLSYLLGITKLDPIKYDLLFSRFLNSERISLPDIDVDFDKARRDEVKQYLAEKYGQDRVASIATFGTMKIRACIKDIIRSLRLGGSKSASFQLADQINKTLEAYSPDITFDEAMMVPAFAEWMEKLKSDKVPHYAQKFEGIIRQTGIHAAGVIVGAEPLADSIPLMMDKNGVVATAYDGVTLEKDGFLKMDLLGLNNLTVIKECIKNIKKVRDEDFKGFYTQGIDVYPDEPDSMFEQRLVKASGGRRAASKAFRLLRDGNTNGVFQCEKPTAQGLLQSLCVNSIEDIAAVLALNRPGPLGSGMTAEYGKRKGEGVDKDEWYLHPSLRPVLKKTYGILVYQESVIRIAMDCAGFTEAEGDSLRKAVGKKIRSLMIEFKEKFIKGCQTKVGMSKAIANELWQLIEVFSSYGFNLSHSVGYAHVTYETAYLKANYPAEFYGALLSNESNQDKQGAYLREAINTGVKVLPVDINTSTMSYECVDTTTIRRDLVSLKGVGAAAVEDILEKRPFVDLVDFLARTNSKRVTSKVINTLIKAGAFDNAFEENYSRKTYFDYYDDCRKKVKRYLKRHETMDGFPKYDWVSPINIKRRGRGKNAEEYEVPVERASKDPREQWSNSEIVTFEEEIYGMPVTYNRFDFHASTEAAFKRKCDPVFTFGEKLDSYEHNDKVYMMVYVRGIAKKSPYKKDPSKFAYRFACQDRTGDGYLTVFDRTYEYDPAAWQTGNTLVLRCKVNVFMERKGLVAEKVIKNCGTIDGRIL